MMGTKKNHLQPRVAAEKKSMDGNGMDMSSGAMDGMNMSSGAMDHGMSMGCGNTSCDSSADFMDENMAMHTAMAISFECDVEVDFVRGMIPHHEGAVKMCEILREHTTELDTFLDDLCTEIEDGQSTEIALMKSWLTIRGYETEASCSSDSMDHSSMTMDSGMTTDSSSTTMDHSGM